MKTLSAPFAITLSITNKCNLRCKHCYASSTRKVKDLGISRILGIIRQIIGLKIFKVSLSGGEPFVRKDFFRILRALSKSKVCISINTNGTLITENIARRLVKFCVRSYIVSLDGSCQAVQGALRGKASFQKTVKGIINLIRNKQNVIISTTVTRFNYNDLENIVLLGKRLGASRVRFNLAAYAGNASCYRRNLAMSQENKRELLKNACRIKSRFGNFITGSLFQIGCPDGNADTRKALLTSLLRLGCGAGIKKCAIRPDGWVVPCEILWDIRAGDLKKHRLSYIWKNSKVLKLFRGPAGEKEKGMIYCWKQNFMKGIE